MTTTTHPTDLNADGRTGLADFFIFSENWLKEGPNPADFNNDGKVAFEDFFYFHDHFGKTFKPLVFHRENRHSKEGPVWKPYEHKEPAPVPHLITEVLEPKVPPVSDLPVEVVNPDPTEPLEPIVIVPDPVPPMNEEVPVPEPALGFVAMGILLAISLALGIKQDKSKRWKL
jgi:hypothetical protein